jgi:hypothetical protein
MRTMARLAEATGLAALLLVASLAVPAAATTPAAVTFAGTLRSVSGAPFGGGARLIAEGTLSVSGAISDTGVGAVHVDQGPLLAGGSGRPGWSSGTRSASGRTSGGLWRPARPRRTARPVPGPAGAGHRPAGGPTGPDRVVAGHRQHVADLAGLQSGS